jgi:Uma2 family endonuclease
VWLADLEQRLMTIYREPSPDGYLSQETVGQNGILTPLAFPDASILVSRI